MVRQRRLIPFDTVGQTLQTEHFEMIDALKMKTILNWKAMS